MLHEDPRLWGGNRYTATITVVQFYDQRCRQRFTKENKLTKSAFMQ
jgi:hypothetical protein